MMNKDNIAFKTNNQFIRPKVTKTWQLVKLICVSMQNKTYKDLYTQIENHSLEAIHIQEQTDFHRITKVHH